MSTLCTWLIERSLSLPPQRSSCRCRVMFSSQWPMTEYHSIAWYSFLPIDSHTLFSNTVSKIASFCGKVLLSLPLYELFKLFFYSVRNTFLMLHCRRCCIFLLSCIFLLIVQLCMFSVWYSWLLDNQGTMIYFCLFVFIRLTFSINVSTLDHSSLLYRINRQSHFVRIKLPSFVLLFKAPLANIWVLFIDLFMSLSLSFSCQII